MEVEAGAGTFAIPGTFISSLSGVPMFLFAAVTIPLSLGVLWSSDCPRRAHLLDDDHVVMALAQEAPESSDESSAGPQWGSPSASLRQRIASLSASRPSLGGGIGLLAGGGALFFGGLSVAYWGFLLQLMTDFQGSSNGVPSSSALPLALMISGLVGAAAGVALIIVGAILLTKAIRARKAVSRELNELKYQLRELERSRAGEPSSWPATVGMMRPTLVLAEF